MDYAHIYKEIILVTPFETKADNEIVMPIEDGIMHSNLTGRKIMTFGLPKKLRKYILEISVIDDPDRFISIFSDILKSEIKSVLSYMDQLLENLPEDKIEEFAKSEQFDTYKKLFKKLGLA